MIVVHLLAALSLAMVASPAAGPWTSPRSGAALHDPEFASTRAAHEAGLSGRTQAGALWRPSVQLEGGVAHAGSESSARGAAFSARGAWPPTDLAGLRSVETPLYLPTAATRRDDVGALGDWLAQVAQRNPGVRVAEARLRAAEQKQRKTSTALSPSLDLVAQIGRERRPAAGTSAARATPRAAMRSGCS